MRPVFVVYHPGHGFLSHRRQWVKLTNAWFHAEEAEARAEMAQFETRLSHDDAGYLSVLPVYLSVMPPRG